MLSGIRLKISALTRMQGTRFVEEALGSREPGADSTGASTRDKLRPSHKITSGPCNHHLISLHLRPLILRIRSIMPYCGDIVILLRQ